MRILLINTNRNRYLSPAPVGALLVAEQLSRDGHDVHFLDLMHDKKPRAALVAALENHRPDLICLSIRNVDNQMMAKLDRPLDEIAEFAALLKTSGKPLLIGGTAVTTFPAQIRAKLGADYAFAGDDVEIFSRFVSSLERGEPDFDAPGLIAEKSGQLVQNPYSIRGYRDLRFGGYQRVNLKTYERKGYYACGVVTHSGCPNGCSFCDAHRTFGRDYILRDPRMVLDELTELRRKHGARSIWLINSGINRPLAYGKELLAKIVEAKLGLSLGCIIEPGEFDGEMARLMKRAGCGGAMIFGTTLDDRVLERNQPFYRRDDIIEAAKLLRDVKLDFFLGQMFGAPGETLAGIRESMETAYRLKPAMMITGYGFRIGPDTPLREMALNEGVIADDDDLFTPHFYLPAGLTAGQIASCLKSFRRSHPWQAVRFVSFIGREIWKAAFARSA